ncbi:replication initiation protein RepC [Enterovirga sp.]|uniref:replication initiation protein RepC n=1 Tax=Enterovirga sp. TaxID=2026350 RepID=UPI003FA56A10
MRERFSDPWRSGWHRRANRHVRSLPKRELPLGIVLDACPSIRDLGRRGEIRPWRDFLATVELARPMLGISPRAWQDAREALGEL